MLKYLKINLIIMILGPQVLLSSTYSTKWKIKNFSKAIIRISCSNEEQTQIKIAMTSAAIYPGKYQNFDWGDKYYNDGLWLNPGKWKCNFKNLPAENADFEVFTTDWGEDITLIVTQTNNTFKLTKISSSNKVKNKLD
ncbi:hypothetical protein [Spirobacillus cienkowskii]|jgi:hypothetical protein|uniref:Uncharacterized protein n=1 Tax=Spirobacillus cienkowskii TaxID=495820 RepID=A0A369KUC4_9BACT|nr:MAG: hypothetical protein DCC88_10685 [Spirobacillus cienkowskii]